MSEELHAINAGVVLKTHDGYRCVVCQRDVLEILPHLRGKDHFNNLAWEVLSNRDPHPSLLNIIPRVVREAKERNELELVDKSHFSLRCLVCPKKPLSSGIKTLETHLNGKEHEKAKKLMPPSPVSYPGSTPQQQFPLSGHQQYQSPQGQNPSNASFQPQYPVNRQPSPQQVAASQPPTQYNITHHHVPTQPQQPPHQVQYHPVSHPTPDTLTYTTTAGAAVSNSPLRVAALQPTAPIVTSGFEPELQRALDDKIVQKSGGDAFKCCVCEKTFTGRTPCLQHLRSDKHKRKAQTWTLQQLPPIEKLSLGTDGPTGRELPIDAAIRNQPSAQQVPAFQPSAQPPMTKEQLTPSPQVQNPASSQSPASPPFHTSATVSSPHVAAVLPTDPSATSGHHEPELQRALDENVVRETGGQAFTCCVCEKNFTGPASCLEHLRSDKHKGKAVTRFDGLPKREWPRRSVVERDEVDGSWVFPWRVETGFNVVEESDTVYRNLSMPRGLVLIFNYYFTRQPQLERRGAKRDTFNLRELFVRMGYCVYVYEDFNKSKTEETLNNIQIDRFLLDYDSLIVFVLSHGEGNQTFKTNGDYSMDLDDVRYKFTDSQCPALANKPKLFFVNFCRGEKVEPQAAYDGVGIPHQAPRDMVTVYSCINSFKSLRDVEKGTMFVQAWCEVLAAHAHDTELYDLYQLADRRSRDMNGSTIELQNYAFKKFYFNPFCVR